MGRYFRGSGSDAGPSRRASLAAGRIALSGTSSFRSGNRDLEACERWSNDLLIAAVAAIGWVASKMPFGIFALMGHAYIAQACRGDGWRSHRRPRLGLADLGRWVIEWSAE